MLATGAPTLVATILAPSQKLLKDEASFKVDVQCQLGEKKGAEPLRSDVLPPFLAAKNQTMAYLLCRRPSAIRS